MIHITGIQDNMIANNLMPFSPTHPGEIIKDEIECRGITQRQLSDVTGIAYLAVSCSSVRTCYLYTVMCGNGGLTAVGQKCKDFSRKPQHINKIILQVYAVTSQQIVIEEVDIEINVIPHEHIASCKVIKVKYGSFYVRSIFYHCIIYPCHSCYELRDMVFGLYKSAENSFFYAVSVADCRYFDYLAGLGIKPRSLYIDYAVILREFYTALAFSAFYTAQAKAPFTYKISIHYIIDF